MDRNLNEALAGKTGNYILPFLWMHEGNTGRLKDLVRQVYDSGVRAFCVESRPHEKFGQDEWWTDMGIILEEAQRLGMKVWLLDDKHFPTGSANGLIEKKYPERRKWQLIERHVDAIGPLPGASLLLPRPFSNGPAPEDHILGIVAYPRNGSGETIAFEPVDLSGQVSGDFLYWDIPSGFWRVFYFIKTREGTEQRNYIHLIDRESVDVQIEGVYEPHYQKFKKYFGNTFAGFFSDEPSLGNGMMDRHVPVHVYDRKIGTRGLALPWSDELHQKLNDRCRGKAAAGGDALPFLAGLWYDMGPESPQIRYTYMDIVTALYRDNFCRHIGDWCRSRGVEYIGHVIEDMNAHARLGCSGGHFFRSLEGQDMSGIDIVLHQIIPGFAHKTVSCIVGGGWSDSEFYHYVLAKLGSSLAHISEHQKNRTMCEVFGAYGWAEGVPMMKWLMDYLLVRGVNRFVPHAFSPKFPDPDCPPHFGAAGRDPQFEGFSRLMSYVNRTVHILEGAVHQAPCALLYHAEAEWMNGNDMMLTQKPAKALYDAHMDYDILPLDALRDKAVVEGNCLKVNQERYRCLVVPRSPLLPEEGLETLKALERAGLPVFYVDGAPKGIPNPSVVPLENLAETLAERGFAELKVEGSFPLLRIGHWKRGETDLFMLFNEDTVRPAETTIRFPCSAPGLKIDLLNGRSSAVQEDQAVKVALSPYQSVIYAFGTDLGAPNYTEGNYARAETLDLAWDIELYEMGAGSLDGTFKPYKKGVPLRNITGAGEKPEFSGRIRYQARFTLEKAESAQALDLGLVGHTAKLWLNGQDCGMAIAPPYIFDIRGAAREGLNTLELEAANTLAQTIKDRFSFYLPLPPSGVLGPIRLFR
jgi:hypothetical protein